MLSSDRTVSPNRRKIAAGLALGAMLALSACQFRPLHGDFSTANGEASQLSTVTVAEVNNRVGQQVRNHLLFLLNGGQAQSPLHEARLSVNWQNRSIAALPTFGDSTAGVMTVIVRYDLVDLESGKLVATGTRQAAANYDRTGQTFANKRAERDAENRAAREVAESLRHAIASDLQREGS